ncbi:MAG: hypothetical protein ACTH2Q_10070 [Propionibacteriaceae bacterium]
MKAPTIKVPERLRNTTREHLYSALIALVCIVLAAGALRATDTIPDHERVNGHLDEAAQLDDVLITMSDLRAGSVLLRDNGDVVARTPGLFLVADVRVQAPGVKGGFNRSILHSEQGRTYEKYDSLGGSFKPEAGFEEIGSIGFEVDPDDLEGLVLEAWAGSIFTAYEQHLYIDLEITEELAAELRAGMGQDVSFTYSNVEVAIP